MLVLAVFVRPAEANVEKAMDCVPCYVYILTHILLLLDWLCIALGAHEMSNPSTHHKTLGSLHNEP